MLSASVEVITILVNSKALARACVVLELAQVRDWQSQLLAVPGNPVLNHLLLVESFGEARGVPERVEKCEGGPVEKFALGGRTRFPRRRA